MLQSYDKHLPSKMISIPLPERLNVLKWRWFGKKKRNTKNLFTSSSCKKANIRLYIVYNTKNCEVDD